MTLPRKFLRILIEIVKLIHSCAGRERAVSNLPKKPMEKSPDYYQALTLMHDHGYALQFKIQAYAELKKMDGLQVMPRTEWEAHKWTRIEISVRINLFNKVDLLIPTEKIYQDLNVHS